MTWHYTKDKLPKEGRYVLVLLHKDNWSSSNDDEGCKYDTACLVRGISAATRQQMKAGILPDPDDVGYIMPDGVWEKVVSKRSDVYIRGDEWANNHVPYSWDTFGAAHYFGQEVIKWMEIPR